jgi:5-hydroxyisourate hydrolase
VSALTTHVLDTARGEPAAGVGVRLEHVTGAGPKEIGRASTDADGRVRDLGPQRLEPGTYRLTFGTGEYLARTDSGRDRVFFPEVTVTFSVDGQAPHYHVPLLLSPFGYTTYRGS